MDVNDQLIQKLAHLSRLKFKPEEVEGLKHDLTAMIGMIEKLQEVNTNGVEPLLHISKAVNITRPDVVKDQIYQTEAVQNAQNTEGPFFKVPKVISR